jgi:hypothetical protein
VQDAREDLLIQLRPARHTPAGHAQVDQVPGVLAQRPWALVVAWYTESQVRGDSAGAAISVRPTSDTGGRHTSQAVY